MLVDGPTLLSVFLNILAPSAKADALITTFASPVLDFPAFLVLSASDELLFFKDFPSAGRVDDAFTVALSSFPAIGGAGDDLSLDCALDNDVSDLVCFAGFNFDSASSYTRNDPT